LADVYRTISEYRQRLRPIVRIEFGMSEYTGLRRSVPHLADSASNESRIYGVPFVVLPVEQHFRVVEADR
jgi:hypothetical protein